MVGFLTRVLNYKFNYNIPCLTLPYLSKVDPWHKQTHPLYAPKYGTGMQPKWVHEAEQTKILVFPDGVNTTSPSGSISVDLGSEFSCEISLLVNLLTNIGSPFHIVCKHSPGGRTPTSNSL
jgi:hypothetical protein